MADPSREEEQVTLLGEEGLMAGGQALKLGYAQIDYKPSLRCFDFPLLSWNFQFATGNWYALSMLQISHPSQLKSFYKSSYKWTIISSFVSRLIVSKYERKSKYLLDRCYILQRLYCDADTGVYRSPLRQALESAGL